jgi:hypothetical protein
MTREQIIQMAEKCGIPEFENNESQADNILRFAALVAAAEREACAQIVDANAKQCGTAIRLILESNAAAIRARGETK